MKSCKNCVHSRWQLTQAGRIQNGGRHLCVIQLPVINLPDSVTSYYGFRRSFPRVCIQPNGGENCPCHVKTDEKPKAVTVDDWKSQG